MRAVIYARYSTDHQREASIEDEVEVCRRAFEAQGYTLARVFYDDRAISGGSPTFSTTGTSSPTSDIAIGLARRAHSGAIMVA